MYVYIYIQIYTHVHIHIYIYIYMCFNLKLTCSSYMVNLHTGAARGTRTVALGSNHLGSFFSLGDFHPMKLRSSLSKAT